MPHTQLPELLAPAGDRERLEAAVRFGADAVYLAGKRYGLRAAPSNFGMEELASAVSYCHGQGVRVYLTCNTLPTNREADEMPDFLRQVAGAGVDAVIVADIGVLLAARRAAPDLEIHISTQMGVVNYLAARELHSLGAKRVVLARELSLEDIATIRAKTPRDLQIEVFVHGAMCMSFSGRCLISQYLTGRDGNRGQCAQPCRWNYRLVEETRPGQYFPIVEEEEGSYILNAKDLSMLPHLDQLIAAGADSLKIEGRAKSAYYVAVVTGAYRAALDLYRQNPGDFRLPDWLLQEPLKVSHRPYTTGFFFPEQPPTQTYEDGRYIRDWEVVAVVESWEDGILTCISRNRFAAGDSVEILGPGAPPVSLTIEWLRDEEGEPVTVSRHPMTRLRFPTGIPFPPGALIRQCKCDKNPGDG